MTVPRPILSGATSLVTRSCTQQLFLLKPDSLCNQTFQYCLAYAVQQTNLVIHGVCVMSNHYHLVETDPEARLPEFERILNKLVASCMNTRYGRRENFFAGSVQPSYVSLETPSAALDKLVYTISNPVKAGLVRSSAEWPGVCLWRPRTYKTRRPSIYFDEHGPMPKSLPLEIVPLPLPNVSGNREYEEYIGDLVAEREKELRATRRADKKTFLGVAGVRAQKETESPRSSAERGGLSPKVAARSKWHRIEALQRIQAFVDHYLIAFEKWCGGDREVLFPTGVYKMRVVHNVQYAHQ